MQSKKIIAGTMALLMALGTVSGSLGTVASQFSIVASAEDSVASDAKVADKLTKVGEVVNYEAAKIKDGAADISVSENNQASLAAVISDIVDRVNGIENGLRFAGTNIDGTTLGVAGAAGTLSIPNYSYATGSSISATLAFTAADENGKDVTVSYAFEIPVTTVTEDPSKASPYTVFSAVQLALVGDTANNIAKKIVVSEATTANDELAVAQAAAAAYPGASVDVTTFQDQWDANYGYWTQVKVTINNSSYEGGIWLSGDFDKVWSYIVNKVDANINALTFTSATDSDQAKAALIDAAMSVNQVYSAELVTLKDFTAPSYGKTGRFAGTYKITFNWWTGQTETKDFDITIPALTKTPDEELADINEAVKQAVSDYKYNTSSATTVSEVEAVAIAAATAKGATLTPSKDFYKGDSWIEFDYTITYPNATAPISDTAGVSILSDTEKANAAKADVEKALKEYKATNTTTADDVLKVANDAAAKYGITLGWDSTNPFVKRIANDTTGEIYGALQFTGTAVTVDVNLDIAASGTDPIALAKSALNKYFTDASSVSYFYNDDAANGTYDTVCSTDDLNTFITGIDDTVKSVAESVSSQTNTISITDASFTADGKLSGNVILTDKNGNTENVPFEITLGKLYTYADRVNLAKAEVEKYLAEYPASTSTTSSGVVNAVNAYLNNKFSNYYTKVVLPQKYGDTDIELVNDGKTAVTGTLVVKSTVPNVNTTADVNVNIKYSTVTDKYAEAVKVAKATLNAYTANNETTKADVISAVNKALKDAGLSGFTFSETTVDPFVINKATDTTTGSIVGSAYVTDNSNGNKTVIDVALTISKLKSNDEILVDAKKAIVDKLAELKATNETTDADVLAIAKAAVEDYMNSLVGVNGITVAWNTDNGFKLTEATSKEAGSVTGSLDVTYSGIVSSAPVNLEISKLADTVDAAEILAGAKAAVDTKLASYAATNDTTADDVLTAAKTAIDEYVATLETEGVVIQADWNSENTFKLTAATTSDAGAITGAIKLYYSDNEASSDVNIKIDKLEAKTISVAKVKISSKFSSTTDAVRINWTKVSGAAGYRVYKLNTTTGEYETVATLGNGSVTTYRISGLAAGTEYKFKVKAYKRDDDGKAVWGKASNAVTTATKPVATKVTKNNAVKDSVRLYFNASKGADGYKVQQYNASTKKWETVKIVSGTQAKITGLKSKTTYKYRVQAFKRVGSTATTYSAWSSVYTCKTK